MNGMQPGIIILREGTDTSQVCTVVVFIHFSQNSYYRVLYSQHSSYPVSIVFRSLIFSQNSCVFPFLSSPHIVSKTIEIMNFFLFVSVIVYRVSDVFVYCREYHNLLVILTPVRLWQIPYGLH